MSRRKFDYRRSNSHIQPYHRCEAFDDEVIDYLYRAGLRNIAFAPESGDTEILKSVKKRVDLAKLEKVVKSSIKRGLIVGVFIVIGFPKDSKESLKKTLKLVRKMALSDAYDCTVSKFVPYPGSELFFELQQNGKIDLDDKFFNSPVDFYSDGTHSYCEGLNGKELYDWMIKLFWNFYLLSFITHPIRTARICLKALLTRKEETRYAKFLTERVFTRTIWYFKSLKYKFTKSRV